MLLTLACLAGIVSLTACTGSMEEPPNRLAQGILENETLGVTFRPGMTREEIEAQPIETFVSSSTMGEVTDARYGMTQLDSILVYYHDGIACMFRINGEMDQESGHTEDGRYTKDSKADSHWTVDGLGFDATREEIKAWYGEPTWEARGNLGYHYREDGSFIDAETWQELYEDEEAEVEGCSGVDDGTAFSVDFDFWESEHLLGITVAGSSDAVGN